MNENKLPVAMAVLYFMDQRYTGGRKPIGFTNKKAFDSFIEFNRGRVFDDEILIIQQGGGHCVAALDEVRGMTWIMDAA